MSSVVMLVLFWWHEHSQRKCGLKFWISYLRQARLLQSHFNIARGQKGILTIQFWRKIEVLKKKFFFSIDVQIYATHRTPHKKYRVNGLTKDGASIQTFPFEKAGNTIQMTVKDYFEKELNLPIRYNHNHFSFGKFYLHNPAAPT